MKTVYIFSKKTPFLLLIIFLVIGISSCTTAKKINYFQNLPDSTNISLPLLSEEERIIQKGDRVEIAFGAKDNDAADIFNKYGGIPTSGSEENSSQGNSDLGGYLIESDGKVEFPLIGRVKAEGLTTAQLKQSLTELVAPYLK